MHTAPRVHFILKKKPIHLNYTSELLFDFSILKIRLETNHDRFVIELSIDPYFLLFEQFLLTARSKESSWSRSTGILSNCTAAKRSKRVVWNIKACINIYLVCVNNEFHSRCYLKTAKDKLVLTIYLSTSMFLFDVSISTKQTIVHFTLNSTLFIIKFPEV